MDMVCDPRPAGRKISQIGRGSPVPCCKAGNTTEYLCCEASTSYQSIDDNGELNVTFHEPVPETVPYGGELDRYEQ